VCIKLAKVEFNMIKHDRISGMSSLIVLIDTYIMTDYLVYTILFSVVISSVVARFTETSSPLPQLENEKLKLQKLLVNPIVIRGALAMVTLNIGANIAFGKINGDIANQEVNVDN